MKRGSFTKRDGQVYEITLEPCLPVTWPTASMRRGEYLDRGIGFAINDRERKPSQRELARAGFSPRPDVGRLHDEFKRVVELADKLDGRGLAALQIPGHGGLKLIQRIRMDVERLSGH